MRSFLSIFSIILCLICVPSVFAFDNEDLEKLLSTNECTGGFMSSCDLEGVELIGKDLANANL